jgi:hypothetical protein
VPGRRAAHDGRSDFGIVVWWHTRSQCAASGIGVTAAATARNADRLVAMTWQVNASKGGGARGTAVTTKARAAFAIVHKCCGEGEGSEHLGMMGGVADAPVGSPAHGSPLPPSSPSCILLGRDGLELGSRRGCGGLNVER